MGLLERILMVAAGAVGAGLLAMCLIPTGALGIGVARVRGA